jgi:hypothetical protein
MQAASRSLGHRAHAALDAFLSKRYVFLGQPEAGSADSLRLMPGRVVA